MRGSKREPGIPKHLERDETERTETETATSTQPEIEPTATTLTTNKPETF